MKETNNGRLVVTQHEVRNAIYSATASVTTQTITALIAEDADYFNDIIEISFSNNSTVAALIDLRSDGSRVKIVSIPANATTQLWFDAPLKQGAKNSIWSLALGGSDVTGTTITVDATYLRNNP